MNEASKTMHYYSGLLDPIFSGRSILDVGAGQDPVKPWAHGFDMEQGDAQDLSKYSLPRYGCVFSSHCLEHMENPAAALLTWWDLVDSGGYLVFIVPEEDLYEQGNFPSIFNGDHKATFTIAKENSWSPKSYNVNSLLKSLNNSEVLYCNIQDDGYDRSKLNFRFYFKFLYFLLRKKSMRTFRLISPFMYFLHLWPIDQTSLNDFRLAQIMAIVRKPE